MSDLIANVDGGVATLTMNRPKARNALSTEMRADLCDALHDAERDPAVRCVVLTGAGEHFMAGGDVKGMAESMAGRSPEPNPFSTASTICTRSCSPCGGCPSR